MTKIDSINKRIDCNNIIKAVERFLNSRPQQAAELLLLQQSKPQSKPVALRLRVKHTHCNKDIHIYTNVVDI